MKPISALNISTPALCIALSAVAALSASARTVYDAGKALKANCTSGGYANPYTDANGGIWSYNLSDNVGNPKSVTLATGVKSDYSGGSIAGFAVVTANKGRSIRVNFSDRPISTGSTSEPLDVDELFMFPGGAADEYSHVRFTAPAAGWYSAFVSAHDLIRGAIDNTAGVELRVLAQGNLLVSGIVSLEDRATRRMDFQMPVRYLAAGETIDVLVGYNTGNSNDDTGVKFIVTKEDDGAFYDSGIAMTNCVANEATYTNPYGTIKDGTWYFLNTTVPSTSVDFATWAPANFGHSSGSRISYAGARSDGLKGFGVENTDTTPHTIKSPYVAVNDKETLSALMAPCELQAHPNGSSVTTWTTIRFRPPVSGYYSGSVVARDVNKGSGDANGVDVYLLVSENVVTNAYISAETFSSTTHLEFDSRLMVAGEPVDIVISSHGQASSDATGISAIFRREDGIVYDAGKSFYDKQMLGDWSHPFADALGGGAMWDMGAKTNAWSGQQFYVLPFYFVNTGDTLTWNVYSANNDTKVPRFAMAMNGIASVDSLYITKSLLLATIPYEFVAQPNTPGYQSSSPTLKAVVPSDGVYRARSYVRDLNNNNTGDGVRFSIVANGCIPVTGEVTRDSDDALYEAAFGADGMWLKAGEPIEFVVDPKTGNATDATGLTACYERTGDATARVINIDITGSDENYVGVGREGWSDWTRWNGIRFSSKLPAASERTRLNCREADGTTKRNVAFTLKRDSSADIEKGWSPTGYTGPTLLRIWAKSTGPSDTYTFTLSKLKKNEPYTLYLYSSKGMDASGNAVDGNAVFTVGGVTKGADETWNLRDAKVVARFDVTSDANGEISGTFVAGSADTSSLADSLKGGAFNGLTLVGQFPDYVPVGTSVIFR